MFVCFLSWGCGMWFFHHSPRGLHGLSGYLELQMVSLPYCGGGGVLVVDFLPASNFDASALRVDFVAGMLVSASDLGVMFTFSAGTSSILPLGQSSKCVLS
jgi:hypothetical protein